MEDSPEALYRLTKNHGYKSPAHIFAMDYFRPESKGLDDFTRKEVWFYYCGDIDLRREFSGRLQKLLDDLFIANSIEWDFITLAPSGETDELNENLLHICREASTNLDLEYRQVLRRTSDVKRSQKMRGSQEQLHQLEGSIEVFGDVEGENIILLDHVSFNGFELSHMTEKLLEAGARRVFCVCLGVTNHRRGVERLEKGVTASAAAVSEDAEHAE